jgi:glycosyltransferase involved in cell wall biosynthesis
MGDTAAVRISVVVPFRDAARHFHTCLAALARQEPFEGTSEVIAVDDRSSDGSARIAAAFPDVRVIRSDGVGPYAARNAGVRAATGDAIAFMDADCEPEANWLSEIARAFATPETAVVVGPRIPGGRSLALSLVTAYDRAKDDYVFRTNQPHLFYATGHNMAVRREVLEAVGLFPERRRGGDTLLVRLIAAGRPPAAVRYCPELRVRHLEVDTIRAYYVKCLAYGRSMQAVNRIAGRSLRLRERLEIWRRAVRRERYSPVRSALLFATLVGGLGFWALGSASASLRPVERS